MKFTEAQLEQAFIHLLQDEQMVHQPGNQLRQNTSGNILEPLVAYGNIVSDQVAIDHPIQKRYPGTVQI